MRLLKAECRVPIKLKLNVQHSFFASQFFHYRVSSHICTSELSTKFPLNIYLFVTCLQHKQDAATEPLKSSEKDEVFEKAPEGNFTYRRVFELSQLYDGCFLAGLVNKITKAEKNFNIFSSFKLRLP